VNEGSKIVPRTFAVLNEGIRDGQHLGAQLCASLRGEIVTEMAVGESRHGVAMAPETINLWFSSGKPLTAVAIALLWEAGLLDLDATVATYVPQFGQHGKEQIVIRHLLNHTAGFRSADRIKATLPWDEAVQAICATPIEAGWTPGERAGYQLFSSWLILGEIVRRIDGRMIDRFVAEEILVPLGMNDCWMALPPDRFESYGRRLGWMHYLSTGGLRPHSAWNSQELAMVVRPGGNVRGPIQELVKFYEALLGVRKLLQAETARQLLLRPSTVAEFTRRQRVGMFDETFRHAMDWGLGFAVNSNRYGADTVPYGFGNYASEAVFGHGGSQSSCGFADPAHQLAVAWVCNGMIGETAHQQRALRINSAIYEDLRLR
jgi:CubicO group peptidase (beta-lactamase class C family)